MARRQLQQRGDLRNIDGAWRVRWREYLRGEDGTIKQVWSRFHDVCAGDMPKKEAQRLAWETWLSKIDRNQRTPASSMTVEQYVRTKFLPQHTLALKAAGRSHYDYMLPHVLDYIGPKKLRDVCREDIVAMVAGMFSSVVRPK